MAGAGSAAMGGCDVPCRFQSALSCPLLDRADAISRVRRSEARAAACSRAARRTRVCGYAAPEARRRRCSSVRTVV